MSVNVEVTKNQNENATSLIRRFTRRVQGSGVLKKVRSIRYQRRDQSKYIQKKQTLKRIAKKKVKERLWKMGKI